MAATRANGKKLFELGRILATPGALELDVDLGHYIARHALGDWGELCVDDLSANDRAIVDGERIFSAYELKGGQKLWVITEADRSATTALLPEEY